MRLPAVFLALLVSAPVLAQDAADNLLPVEQAFALTASAPTRGSAKLEWKIADGYYLYRGRIKTKPGAGVTLGALDLPAGEKKHDEFLGDVEVYHHAASATQTFTLDDAAAGSVELTVVYQGCHQVEPKICYPPHPTKLTLVLPAADAAAAPGGNSLGSALGKLGGDKSAPMDSAAPGTDALPLPPEQAFRFETIALSPTQLLARWTMPKGYYLYRDKTQLSPDPASGVTLGALQWPKGVQHKDEHFGDVTVFFDQVELPIALVRTRGEAGPLALTAEFQGCEDGGVCYPVMTRKVSIDLPAATAEQMAAAKAVPASAAPTAVGEQSEEQRLASLLGSNKLWGLLVFFGFGLLLAFTPCVFPMIPILSGIIVGAGENLTKRRAFVLSAVYVLSSCLVFTVVGVIIGLLGTNLQAAFQKPWILSLFAIVFVALSFSMFGYYELQLPSSWQSKITNISNRQQSGSLLGVAIMGVLSTFIVGPCVAPPLAAAVVYISQAHDPFFGGLALFALSLGMGSPLLIAGVAIGSLPRAGGWMDAVKAVFGVCFLALAIWMLSRFLAPLWIMLLTGALLIGCATFLGALRRLPAEASGYKMLWQALGLVLLVAGAAELVGAAAGSRDLLQPLSGLRGGKADDGEHLAFRTIKSTADLDKELAAGKPVLLDFYADWCVSCKEMEKFTFSKPEVAKALGGFTLLKADVTANDDTDQALLKRFELFGPPATIFFAEGKEKRALRLIGFEDADKFAARAGKAR
jgi:thiol:disulfide interchange protein DsbD